MLQQSSSFKYQQTSSATRKHCSCPISCETSSRNGKQGKVKRLGLSYKSKALDIVENKCFLDSRAANSWLNSLEHLLKETIPARSSKRKKRWMKKISPATKPLKCQTTVWSLRCGNPPVLQAAHTWWYHLTQWLYFFFPPGPSSSRRVGNPDEWQDLLWILILLDRDSLNMVIQKIRIPLIF